MALHGKPVNKFVKIAIGYSVGSKGRVGLVALTIMIGGMRLKVCIPDMLSVREFLTFLEGDHDSFKKIQTKIARRATVALKRAAKTTREVEEQAIKQRSTHEQHARKGTPLIFCHFEKYFINWQQYWTKTSTLMDYLKM